MGTNLKALREYKLKETQEAFAQRMGVTTEEVAKWEDCGDDLPLKVIQKIVQRTGLSLEEVCSF